MLQALLRSVQLNIVFPSGLQPHGSGGCKGRAVTENGNSLVLWGNLSCLLRPRVGFGEHLTLGKGRLDLRRVLSQGAEVGALALFIWAVDIAWRKERRNVGLGSASSSSGSAQL